MASHLPLRLLSLTDDELQIVYPQTHGVNVFDIISYTWGATVAPYRCDIPGVVWNVTINPQKLQDIKRLMQTANIQYLWADCVCLNQEDDKEMVAEAMKMYEYYKSARKCYILMEMNEVWNPESIMINLKFLDHILSHIHGAALAAEANLSDNTIQNLSSWDKDEDWKFPLDRSIVKSTGIDLGLLNCYSTSVNQVQSLFDNPYFVEVRTFQEMLLGKNITMYGINEEDIFCIGELDTWMDLATETMDKAVKLHTWIIGSRVLRTSSINKVLKIIDEDCAGFNVLQTQVKGINSARTDIINGGPRWWYECPNGISNIFSAISMRPRQCFHRKDLFRGLLGIFSGLFTREEVERDLVGDDIDKLTYIFFKQLSIKTENAWTILAISSGERTKMDWIPVTVNHNNLVTTDIFAGVVHLGRMKSTGCAKSIATTGILGSPKSYMKILLHQDNRGWQFTFKGCNAGKKVSTGLYGSEPIPVTNQLHSVAGDETGKTLVRCATIMGSLLDPGYNVVDFRRRMLNKLQLDWTVSDPNAKPTGWVDRCVSGTDWGDLNEDLFRVHNRSMNCQLGAVTNCASRLYNETTAGISCEIRVNCGCSMTGPFPFMFEAVTAVQNGALGGISTSIDEHDRITLRDGLGFLQVGDVGKAFNLIATRGDIDYHKSYASLCRSTKTHKPVVCKSSVPRGRALVSEDFTHKITDSMRDYGFVDFTNRLELGNDENKEIRGPGNLLICRNNPLGHYKIVGVCIDNWIENKGGENQVTIR